MSSEESGSDMELPPVQPKNQKKQQHSPTADIFNKNPNVPTTKDMVREALTVLDTKKGVSLHAIKKFIGTKYDVNLDKVGHLIKRNIKNGVDKGLIKQTKGIGASGSFRLVPDKTKKVKNKEVAEEASRSEKKVTKKMKKPTPKVTPEDGQRAKLTKPKVTKKDVTKEAKKEDKLKVKKSALGKTVKIANGVKETPKKKKMVIKRKSIGSIIKKPKMKPKAQSQKII